MTVSPVDLASFSVEFVRCVGGALELAAFVVVVGLERCLIAASKSLGENFNVIGAAGGVETNFIRP